MGFTASREWEIWQENCHIWNRHYKSLAHRWFWYTSIDLETKETNILFHFTYILSILSLPNFSPHHCCNKTKTNNAAQSAILIPAIQIILCTRLHLYVDSRRHSMWPHVASHTQKKLLICQTSCQKCFLCNSCNTESAFSVQDYT
jgi:hypothetical protein